MNSPTMADKVSRTKRTKASQIDLSDGEGELSPSQILERVKPDRVTVTKPEEDRRRRTIIVEKCNDSYGFTLQSYGIHYKKEQEIEMITYVDYVDYDGPAYRAGMREGDVILSINGHDMEKADHKTLVNFIKNCDSRMRMVVLFEDCVKKVELHMRYIQLQRILQSKMAELERLCVRERELLQGKWKTHSLPARKKASKTAEASAVQPVENGEGGLCRPTVSTEDMARATPPPGFGAPPLMLAYRPYQYIDQQGRTYVLQPAHNSAGDYFVGWPSYQGRNEGMCIVRGGARRCSASAAFHDTRGYHQSNGVAAAPPAVKHTKAKSSSHSRERSHCNPCMASTTSPQDNTSLEAYDLASPCCNSQCVPSRRRRHHHKPKKSASNVENTRGEWKDKNNRSGQQGSGYMSSSSAGHPSSHHHHHHHQPGRKYFNLASQCSLHSCTSSEVNSGQERTVVGNDSSAASYTTSLSTDTLYWEPPNDMTRQHSVKSNTSSSRNEPAKPKSWDNLTTKAFGGYGFGYGYTERDQKGGGKGCGRKGVRYGGQQPNKSTESLLYPGLSDSSLSCECLEATSPTSAHNPRFFSIAPADQYYHRDKASQTDRRIVNIEQAPEITRL